VVIIVPPPSGSTNIQFHTSRVPMLHHPTSGGGCGIANIGNAETFDVTVNGVTAGTNLALTNPSCNQNPPFGPFPDQWNHYPQNGPSHILPVTGSLTNATIVMTLKDNIGNPALFSQPLQPMPMFSTSMAPITGVLSGINNATVTWTGVDISPSFLSYVHLYFLNPYQ